MTTRKSKSRRPWSKTEAAKRAFLDMKRDVEDVHKAAYAVAAIYEDTKADSAIRWALPQVATGVIIGIASVHSMVDRFTWEDHGTIPQAEKEEYRQHTAMFVDTLEDAMTLLHGLFTH